LIMENFCLTVRIGEPASNDRKREEENT
jgi:hypothetical protein